MALNRLAGHSAEGKRFFLVLHLLNVSTERLSFQLPLDGSKWEIGYKAGDKTQLIFEYVLQGETVENWTELVTIQSFDKQYIKYPPPETAMNLLKERMVQRCPAVAWNVIERQEGSILYLPIRRTKSPKA